MSSAIHSFGIVGALLFGVLNATVTSFSVDRQRGHNTYILQPWTTRNGGSSNEKEQDLVQVSVDFTNSLLKVTTSIPSGVNASSNSKVDHAACPVTIQVPIPEEEGNLASSLWPASCVASAWWTMYGNAVLDKNNNDSSRSTRILELGSGLGVTGWMAAAVVSQLQGVAELTLTDLDDGALKRLSESPQCNLQLSSVELTTRKLDWRDEHDPLEKEDPFDIVVGSDLSYYHFLVGPLADTLETFGSNALVTIASPTSRQSFWELYHLMKDGGYNVKTDTYGDPWPGTVRMLLYRLHCVQDDSHSPMALLCWTADAEMARRLDLLIDENSDIMHVATAGDEAQMEMSF